MVDFGMIKGNIWSLSEYDRVLYPRSSSLGKMIASKCGYNHAENTALYKNNGITIKLYGVSNETRNTNSFPINYLSIILSKFIYIFMY